jgi:hypothetical protein
MLAGGEHGITLVLPRPQENLCAYYGWSDVQVGIVAGGRRYLVENAPRKRSSSSSGLGLS